MLVGGLSLSILMSTVCMISPLRIVAVQFNFFFSSQGKIEKKMIFSDFDRGDVKQVVGGAATPCVESFMMKRTLAEPI